MSNKLDQPDYLQAISNYEIEIEEHKQNIKDARSALRHSQVKLDKKAYRRVIAWNKQNIREAKTKIRIIRAGNERSWWMWLVAIVGCFVILIVFPGAPVIVILSPLWIVLLLGFFSIIQMVRK